MFQATFHTSADTSKLDSALAKAQGEMLTAQKDKVNPHYRSKYADITAVWDACRAALSKYEISVTQWPIHSEDSRLHIITRLSHAGEYVQGHFSIPVVKQDAHGYGSAVTYAKRFALAAAVGVVADEYDDDGNEASTEKVDAGPRQETPRPQAAQPAPKHNITDVKALEIRKLLEDRAWPAAGFMGFLKLKYNVERVGLLTEAQLNDALETVRSRSYEAAMSILQPIQQKRDDGWDDGVSANMNQSREPGEEG